MSLVARLAQGRLHYGWIVAGLTFVTLLAAAGIRSTVGLLIVPLELEFGWTRATISIAVSVNLVLYGLMGPFAAALVDRWGMRRTMSLSLTLVALGVCLTPLITAPWQLVLLWGVVVGAGTGMTALFLGAMVANRWFAERRGVVVGILTASTATGQLVFLPALAAVVQAYGWRAAVLTVAAFALAIAPVVALMVRSRPADLGLRPYGATAPEPPAPPPGNPFTGPLQALWDGLHRRDFWLLTLGFFICGASTNGLVGTHLIAACFDHGIPEVRAAGLLALMGIFDFIGTTVSGWLSDRYDNRWLLFWYYGLRGISLVYLPHALELSFVGLSLFAVFYGLDWIATVPPTVRLASNAFGKEKVGIMFGWIVAAHQLGAACAAFGAGFLRTSLGGYLEAFTISGLLCLVAALASLAIGRRTPEAPAPAMPAPAR